MKRYQKKDAYFPERDASTPSEAAPDEASARRIIEDYLHQVGMRLPSAIAKDVIPELRSHLLEQASQPSGRLTPDAAWNAVVAMGSPDLLAHEFHREATAAEAGRIGGGFLNALKPVYRAWFWRIALVMVIVDILVIALKVSQMIAMAPFSPLEPYVASAIAVIVELQVWVGAGIAIAYLALVLASNPQGVRLAELFRGLTERPDWRGRRIHRAQRHLRRRVRKLAKLVSRRSLSIEMAFQIGGGMCLALIAVILAYLLPVYPSFDILFLLFVAALTFGHAAFTALRVIVDADYLGVARVLAYLDVLWSLVGIYGINLFFYGPLSLPVPLWDQPNSSFVLFGWKPYVMMFSWIAPLLVLLVVLSMAIRIFEVTAYLRAVPLEPSPPL